MRARSVNITDGLIRLTSASAQPQQLRIGPRVISSGGWITVRCIPANSVIVLNALPSWSLTGSVPALTVRPEDETPTADFVPRTAR